MKLLAICLLCVGLTIASPTEERAKRGALTPVGGDPNSWGPSYVDDEAYSEHNTDYDDDHILYATGYSSDTWAPTRNKRDIFTGFNIQNIPVEERSAPGVVQPHGEWDGHHEEDAFAHSIDTFQEYGPEHFSEYGVPKIHEEYGVPVVPTLKVDIPAVPATDHVCPEEDIKQKFLPEPPSPPEIVPLPEIPIVKYVEPVIPHDEYGPPVTSPPVPLCSNGAPDASYPFCCENGATNQWCCLGEWINPTCSEPVTGPYPPRVEDEFTIKFEPEVFHEEYGPPVVVPPAPLCNNGAPDVSYPFCCENGATNQWCCLGEWINPTCSEPKIIAPYPPKVEVTTTTTTPGPLCLNGAPDVSYPFCCVNGATNPYCCVGEWINPTCSEPKTIEIPEVIAPYPPKVEVTTTTTTTTPGPLCLNGAPDVSYPFCCENGATNPYCCVGEWINPTCSEPTTTTTVAPTTLRIAPYPPKVEVETKPEIIAPYPPKVDVTTTTTQGPLCLNGAPDVSYPFCCVNGATNPYCCVGEWINPTCSEPTTVAPTTLRLAPYPAPVTTTTTTPAPKLPYADKIYSKYDDTFTRGETGFRGTGTVEGGIIGFSGEGLIDVRIPEIVGRNTGTNLQGGEVRTTGTETIRSGEIKTSVTGNLGGEVTTTVTRGETITHGTGTLRGDIGNHETRSEIRTHGLGTVRGDIRITGTRGEIRTVPRGEIRGRTIHTPARLVGGTTVHTQIRRTEAPERSSGGYVRKEGRTIIRTGGVVHGRSGIAGRRTHIIRSSPVQTVRYVHSGGRVLGRSHIRRA